MESVAVVGFVFEPPGAGIIILEHAVGVGEMEAGVVEGGIEGDVADVADCGLGVGLRCKQEGCYEDKKWPGHT